MPYVQKLNDASIRWMKDLQAGIAARNHIIKYTDGGERYTDRANVRILSGDEAEVLPELQRQIDVLSKCTEEQRKEPDRQAQIAEFQAALKKALSAWDKTAGTTVKITESRKASPRVV